MKKRATKKNQTPKQSNVSRSAKHFINKINNVIIVKKKA